MPVWILKLIKRLAYSVTVRILPYRILLDTTFKKAILLKLDERMALWGKLVSQ